MQHQDGQSGTDARTPPSDVDAERMVLGAMMISPDALAEIAEIVKAGDYYNTRHATIHSTIIGLFTRGEPADALSVTARLIATKDITRVGGAPYLHECIESVPTVANGAYHARRVADLAARRRLITAGTKIAQIGFQPDLEIGQAFDQAGAEFYDATTQHDHGDLEPAHALIGPAVQAIEDAADRESAIQGLSTGFADLDRLLNGLKGGQLIVVAARPGMGKSVFVGDIARTNALYDGKSVAIFNLEMKKNEVINRILAATARVPLSSVKAGNLSDADWRSLAPAIQRFGESDLHIDDSANLTMTEVRSRSRRVSQRTGLDLVIIDYLQLMQPSGRRVDNRQQEVAEISRGLKMLAKELDVPVIAVAQLNRGVEQRSDKRPMLSDLRESGALEQDADVVILVHRDDYYDKESPRGGEADFIVAKHRDGATDTITVAAQLHLSRFADMAIV